jgi:Copper type II ascorbate-dependent monooxygenase, C-terminal domain
MRSTAFVLLVVAACAAPPEALPAVSDVPTYYADVAPLVGEHCAGCHTQGGSAPFPLDTYEQVADRAGLVAHVTHERLMPPWPADSSGACNTFVGARWLDDAAIATFAQWRDAGAPAGEPRDTAVGPPVTAPFTETVRIGASAPYVVAPGPDEYRCFVVDPMLDGDRYITALAMQLDRADVVHHMQLFAADKASEETTLDALAGPAGYACGEEGVGAPLRYVGVWAPGDDVRRWPEGSGIVLRGGHRLVVQIHYHNHGAVPVSDQTHVALELAETVEHVGDIRSARNTALYLPPGLDAVTAVGTHEIGLTGTARAVRIHMHELGTRARLELIRGDQARCLLDIPRWDFGWQLFYSFAEPIALEVGDHVRLTCAYDTRSQTEPVRWGLGTNDEMCIGYTFATR